MRFPIEITFRGVEPSEAVETRIRALAEKLDTVYDRIQRCDVVVEAPHRHHRHGRRFHVRVDLAVPGELLIVSHDPGDDGAHEDVNVAVRDAFVAARRQVEDWAHRQAQHTVEEEA